MENFKNTHPITISIKNEIEMIYPVQAATRAYAAFLGFKNKGCFHLELLLEEVLTNIIKFDFIPGKKESIHINMERSTLGIVLTVHSLCIPLDIEKIKSYYNVDRKDILNNKSAGIGTLLINKFADSVTYSNRGKEGQYIVIEKHLPHEAVTVGDEKELATGLTVNKDFKFYVRRLKPEESYQISRLAYYTYNVSYIYEHIYYPERVRKLNEEGEMISIVGVNEENEDIIGHVAAVKHEQTGMHEMAVAFVNPNYRGGGCLNKSAEFLLDLLKNEGNSGVIVHAVTSHPFSQKAAYKLNLRESALYISRTTPLEMTDLNDDNMLRDSLLLMFLSLKNSDLKDIYSPIHHYEMIKRIYENLGLQVNLITEIDNNELDNEFTEIEISADEYYCSHVFIERYGKDAMQVIIRTLKMLCVHRIESVYLYLPLNCKETINLCAEFESLQFFFGGIVQTNDGTDYIMLQFLNNQIYDYSTLRLFSDFANELGSYVQSKDPNQELK